LTSNFIKKLIDTFSKAPTYAGAYEDLKDLVTETNKVYMLDGKEVVYANSTEIMTLPDKMQNLAEGFYYVGTGSTGLTETLFCLGGI